VAKKLQQEWQDEELAMKLQQESSCLPPPERKDHSSEPFKAVIQKVCRMVHDLQAKRLADKYGLTINQITWEDNARWKNSCWGPCISDMSLQVEDNLLPVIRPPNFEDLTWDVPIEKIPLVVGNHNNTPLKTVTLKEYLGNLRTYLHDPSDWKGDKTSLLAPRDTHVVMSAQACFLPIPKSGEAKFNVGIFNYQSSQSNPAVLAIVASSKGTSAQILDNANGRRGQKLYFNQNGERCSFIGQRLSDFRSEKGENQTTGPMTQQEKQQNMLLIIQVPLKHQETYRFSVMSYKMDKKKVFVSAPISATSQSNVEDAIVKIGASEGKFRGIGGLAIERDDRFPVRVTLQYYKATDNGVVNDDDMKKAKLFSDKRFVNCTLSQCKEQLLDILGSSTSSLTSEPAWNVL
jgi:hypothetical protein